MNNDPALYDNGVTKRGQDLRYFVARQGVQIADITNGGTQNAGQGMSINQLPTTFSVGTEGMPAFLTVIKSTNTYTNIPVIPNAIQEPNSEIALRVSLCGAQLVYAAPTAATVGVASGSAVAANAARRQLILVNTSANNISLGFSGNAAVLNSGITLVPNGSYEISEANGNLYTGAVNAIAAGAGSNLAVQEAT